MGIRVISSCWIFLLTGKLTPLIIVNNFKTRGHIYWSTNKKTRKVNFYERLISKQEDKKEMGGFVLLLWFLVLQTPEEWRQFWKEGWSLPTAAIYRKTTPFATQQDLNCFSKHHSPGMWTIATMSAVRCHSKAGQLNSILDGDTWPASYAIRSRIQWLAYTADRILPSAMAWNMCSPSTKPLRRDGLLSSAIKTVTRTV
jgi:hypothetical protein